MDYELLLKKYMQHVADQEGWTFVSSLNESYASDVQFTEDEVEILQALDSECFDN